MIVLNKRVRLHSSDVVGDAILVDRGSPWGNPFILHNESDRETVCNNHESWLRLWRDHQQEVTYYINGRVLSNKWVMEHIHELQGKDLICWCAPKRCHAETLLKLANAQ